MTSNLPSRWQEILRREAAENVGNVLAQARQQSTPRAIPRWLVPAGVVLLASVSLMGLMGGSEARGRGSLPFDRSTLISTRTAGLGANAEDLAPRRAIQNVEPPAAPTAVPTPLPEPTPTPVRRRPLKRQASNIEATPDSVGTTAPTPAPAQQPTPLVVNIGTRVEALISEPVVTGAALAPATARLAQPLMIGDRVALPEGAILVGEAFATQQDDRAQLVFTAIVHEGRTVPFEGWALQQGEMGVKGKVIRKGSKLKKGAGVVLGAAASALSFGLTGGSSGPGEAALSSLGNSASSEIIDLRRDWSRSDKAVRVNAGVPITVYIRRDLKIE